jgi:hypothetical protein
VTATTRAVGGGRDVRVPDVVARDYLLLALRLDQHSPGLVDGYFGPADLKAQVDLEQLRAPGALAEDAAALLGRLDAETDPGDRRTWLAGQIRALQAQAERLAGVDIPYLDYVTRCFAWRPVARDPAVFDAAASELDRLLPGSDPLAERLGQWDDRFTIPVDRLPAVADWLIATFRARAAATFGLPAGESIHVRLVRDQPWTGYNWYEGGRRSRFDLNTDLPMRATELVHVTAHEAYPGHHLEHAWREADLVDEMGRLEASVLLINTPECLISEGLADLGHRFASPPADEPALLVELYERAGLAIARDPGAARDAAERSVAMAPHRRRLLESRVNAALMRHAEGRGHEEVLASLEAMGRFAPDVAAKRLEFIEHPLWRTYVFVYHEGEALLGRWLEAVPSAERASRFGRLLREQLGPSAIEAELAQATGDAEAGAGSAASAAGSGG